MNKDKQEFSYISTEQKKRVSTVTVNAKHFDVSISEKVKEEFVRYFAYQKDPESEIRLDLGKVKYIDICGLVAVLEFNNTNRRRYMKKNYAQKTSVINCRDEVREMFERTGFDQKVNLDYK